MTRADLSAIDDVTLGVQTEALIITAEASEDASLEALGSERIFDQLWLSLSAHLTPRVRRIIWVARSTPERSIIQRKADELAQLMSVTHPYPTLMVSAELSDQPSVRGGWPKLRRGPKIPSLS